MTNQYEHDQWIEGANGRIRDGQQAVLALLKQRDEEARLYRERLAAQEAERKRQEAEQARRDDEAVADERRAARRAYFAQHPAGSEEGFDRYWQKVKPSHDEIEEARVQATMVEMQSRGWGRL